jgi:hypothetical protein
VGRASSEVASELLCLVGQQPPSLLMGGLFDSRSTNAQG